MNREKQRLAYQDLLSDFAMKRSTKLVSTIILIGVLSLVTGVPLLRTVSATTIVQSLEQSDRRQTLPKFIASEIQRDLARRVGVSPRELQIKEAERRTWRNTCLELPAANEACGEALVEGWRVAVTRNRRVWVYHTDREGRILRMVNTLNESDLPQSVKQAVFQDIVQRTRIPRTSLQIVRAEQKTWSDGCLGLAESGVLCTQALVPGWLVVIEGSKQRLIYRTNASGSIVKLDREASRTLLAPIRISTEGLLHLQ